VGDHLGSTTLLVDTSGPPTRLGSGMRFGGRKGQQGWAGPCLRLLLLMPRSPRAFRDCDFYEGAGSMDPAADPSQQAEVAAIIALFVGLIGIHVCLAFWAGVRTRGAQTWKSLVELSVGTAVVWFILAVAISYVIILGDPTTIVGPAGDMYDHTFGVPFQWNIPGRFFGASPSEIPGFLTAGCTGSLVALISFVLACFVAAVARGYLRVSAALKWRTH
jgi:hypothetical protein